MAAATKDHIKKKEFSSLHQPQGGANGKGCVWPWKKSYRPGHHCSYRWHARVRALADKHLYNYPAYKSLCVDHPPGMDDVFITAAYQGPKERFPSNNYALRNRFPFKKKPRPGQWDVTLPRNFTGKATRPYWHNAHHIIPDAVLRNEFLEAGKEDTRVTNMIVQGLLMASYNLNDSTNMILLPMDRAVAAALGLPRHLLGHEAEEHDIQGREEMDHPDYSRRVRLMIRPIINQYKRLVMEKLTEHPAPPDALAKEQLVHASNAIYGAITVEGKFMRGKSLDELKLPNLGEC